MNNDRAIVEKTATKTCDEWLIWCPACEMLHMFWVNKPGGPNWTFDGNIEKPTFSPSLRVRWTQGDEQKCCHSFVRNGQWEYCGDCTHAMAGKTVPCVPIADN